MRAFLTAAALGAAVATAGAQELRFPERLVRVVVPNPPGTAGDIAARLLGERFAAAWREPAIVENRPGAHGTLGMDAVARSKPDGHTLLYSPGVSVATAAALMPQLKLQPHAELLAVYRLMKVSSWILVRKDLPVSSLQELAAFTRTRPGGATYWTGGGGADRPYFAMALLQKSSGMRLSYVPYNAASDALKDVANGSLDFVAITLAASRTLVDAGRLKPLAMLETARSALAPEVPTAAEAGFAGEYGESWAGLFAPKGTSSLVIERIAGDTAKAVADETFRKRMLSAYMEPLQSSPAEAAARLQRDRDHWLKVIRDNGITLQ
ncbi:MAG: Bug family tripartite tricarboxylate transporter substrate binding protein [Betaproteobacteria bacterium]